MTVSNQVYPYTVFFSTCIDSPLTDSLPFTTISAETEPVRGQQQQPPPELSPYPYHYPAPYGYGQQRYYKKPHHQQRFRGGYGGSSEGISGSDEEGF